MRHNYETLYINENIDQILDVLDKHIANLPTKISNQTDSKYWTYDIRLFYRCKFALETH